MLRKKRWLSMMERCLKRVAEVDENCGRLNQMCTTVETVCWLSESYVQYVYMYICMDHVLMKGVGEYHCTVTLALEVRSRRR